MKTKGSTTSNNFRVGNLVMDFGHNPIQIEHLQINKTLLVKPIMLSHEWLQRLGFSYNNETDRWEYPDFPFYLVERTVVYTSYYVTDLRQMWRFATVTYVHELQNLYFCMEGEELQVKEPVSAHH